VCVPCVIEVLIFLVVLLLLHIQANEYTIPNLNKYYFYDICANEMATGIIYNETNRISQRNLFGKASWVLLKLSVS
jgi:hypothetical protein